jgi:hypothetical protein
VQDVNDLLDHSTSDLSDKLCRIGDRIVYKLVQWTRRLPFYEEIPVEIHTSLLTNKWHELLVLTTSAYQSIHGTRRMGTTRSDGESAELHQEVGFHYAYVEEGSLKELRADVVVSGCPYSLGPLWNGITITYCISRPPPPVTRRCSWLFPQLWTTREGGGWIGGVSYKFVRPITLKNPLFILALPFMPNFF